MSWSLVATILLKVLGFWLDRQAKKSSSDQVKTTTTQQKINGAAIYAINKSERHLRNKLDGVDSLRKQAEAINNFKNSDV